MRNEELANKIEKHFKDYTKMMNEHNVQLIEMILKSPNHMHTNLLQRWRNRIIDTLIEEVSKDEQQDPDVPPVQTPEE